MNGRTIFRWALPVLAVLALGSAGLSVARSNMDGAPGPSTSALAMTAAEAAPVLASVGALGRVEPKGGIRRIAPDRAGVVVTVDVGVGDRVMAGDLLFTLDDRTARLALAEREAEIASARARLDDALAQTPLLLAARDAALARLAEAEARVADLSRDVDVGRRLAAENAVAARDAERRETALAAGQAALAAVRADLASAEAMLAMAAPDTGPDIAIARAALAEAEARLATAASDLAALAVRAREAGVVLSIDIRPGEAADPTRPAIDLAPAGATLLRVFVNEADAARVDTTRPAEIAPLGRGGEAMTAQYLATEPVVRPNAELSGRPSDLIDTRVVEFLYVLPEDAAVLFGQSFDVMLPVRGGSSDPVMSSGDPTPGAPPKG